MTKPTFKSKQLVLREVEPRDKPIRKVAGLDPDYTHMTSREPDKVTEIWDDASVDQWYDDILADPTRWVIEYEGEAIGVVGYRRANIEDTWHGFGTTATCAVGIWPKRYRRLGLGAEALELMFDYAFEDEKIHRLQMKVLETNTAARAAYQSLGFVEEGVERESAMIGGKWVNYVRGGLLEQDRRKRNNA